MGYNGYRNNYNKNADGLSIEAYAYYDTDLSQIYFNDNFKELKDSFYYYSDYGNLSTPDKVRDVAVFDIHTTYNLLQELLEGSTGSRGELVQELLDLDIENLPRLLEEGVVRLKKGYDIYRTRGYCQGDICDVLINEVEIINNRNKTWTIHDEHTLIDHYFWDSPVYARVQVEDEEYEYQDFCIDEYEWNKQAFITAINNKSKYKGEELTKELNKLLPEEIDYV